MTIKQSVSRVALVMSTLIRSGIVYLNALEIAARSTKNAVLRRAESAPDRVPLRGGTGFCFYVVLQGEAGLARPLAGVGRTWRTLRVDHSQRMLGNASAWIRRDSPAQFRRKRPPHIGSAG